MTRPIATPPTAPTTPSSVSNTFSVFPGWPSLGTPRVFGARVTPPAFLRGSYCPRPSSTGASTSSGAFSRACESRRRASVPPPGPTHESGCRVCASCTLSATRSGAATSAPCARSRGAASPPGVGACAIRVTSGARGPAVRSWFVVRPIPGYPSETRSRAIRKSGINEYDYLLPTRFLGSNR